MGNILVPITFLAGTDIIDAIEEALQFANKLNVGITFKFNGASVTIQPGSTIECILLGYKLDLKLLRQGRKNG